MDGFDHLLNWKLKVGSHRFPGPDGGTCINEAALVAVGLPYKRIRSVWQMPKCFSRPICRLALRLNDQAIDSQRQRLLPYVTRLACADTREIERQRAAYIRQHTRGRYPVRFDDGLRILEGALAIGRQADALGVEDVTTRMDAVRANATMATSVTGRSFFSKVKSWITTKETA